MKVNRHSCCKPAFGGFEDDTCAALVELDDNITQEDFEQWLAFDAQQVRGLPSQSKVSKRISPTPACLTCHDLRSSCP
jgi:hypothetical protein